MFFKLGEVFLFLGWVGCFFSWGRWDVSFPGGVGLRARPLAAVYFHRNECQTGKKQENERETTAKRSRNSREITREN